MGMQVVPVPWIETLDPPMPFTFPFQGWKTSNRLTSFRMIKLAPVSREYEVLLVSAMKLNGIRLKFASG